MKVVKQLLEQEAEQEVVEELTLRLILQLNRRLILQYNRRYSLQLPLLLIVLNLIQMGYLVKMVLVFVVGVVVKHSLELFNVEFALAGI